MDGLRTCRVCGCSDRDCLQCAIRTGMPCHWVEADLCSACVGAIYLHDGLEVLVSDGISRGEEFGTFKRKATGSLKRIASPAMPMVPTREEAQRNLDVWARRNDFRPEQLSLMEAML